MFVALCCVYIVYLSTHTYTFCSVQLSLIVLLKHRLQSFLQYQSFYNRASWCACKSGCSGNWDQRVICTSGRSATSKPPAFHKSSSAPMQAAVWRRIASRAAVDFCQITIIIKLWARWKDGEAQVSSNLWTGAGWGSWHGRHVRRGNLSCVKFSCCCSAQLV